MILRGDFVNQKYIAKYNELIKKHEILNKRYSELEKLEAELESNTTLSDEQRLKNLNKLADEYEKVANLMQEITKEAKELQDKMD